MKVVAEASDGEGWFDHHPAALRGLRYALGTLLFSGSLYALALSGVRWLGAVTPLGGLRRHPARWDLSDLGC